MKTRWKVAIVFVLLFAAGYKYISYEISKTASFLAAAYAGQTETINQSLKDGQDVNVSDVKYHGTALIYAAQQGHVATVTALLDHKADINAVTRYEQSALSQAAFNGHLDVVKLLLERGAKLDERFRPGMLKAAADRPDILKLLPPEPEKTPEK